MHAHDRTMLANLGFADPDRKDYRHDLACQYLIRPEVAKRFVPLVIQEPISRRIGKPYRAASAKTEVIGRFTEVKSRVGEGKLEVHIGKGEGKYQTTIGFLDVVIPFDLADKWVGVRKKSVQKEVTREGERMSLGIWGSAPEREKYTWIEHETVWEEEPATGHCPIDDNRVIVEVKAHPVEVGDILRQINLYRQYFHAPEIERNIYVRSSMTPAIPPQRGPQIYVWAVATIFPVSPLFVETLKRSDIHHIRLGDPFHAWVAEQAEAAETSGENSGSVQL